MVTEFRLPDVGEHIETATVVRVLVAPGQRVEKEQTVAELETDKATLEVPSAVAGVVREVMMKEGETIKVGAVLFTVGDDEGGETGAAVRQVPEEEAKPQPAAAPQAPPQPQAPPPPQPQVSAPAEAPAPPAPAAPAPEPQVREEIQRAGRTDIYAPQEATEEEIEQDIKPAIARAEHITEAPSRPHAPAAPIAETTVSASPAVRRLAREIGVAIEDVQGSGPGGRITEEDVKRHARSGAAPRAAAPAARPAAGPLPEFSRYGEVERQPLPTIRRLTGEHMVQSWTTIPHVHQFDKADITELEAARRAYNAKLPADAPKLTMTVILTKLMAGLLGRYPRFNTSLDAAANELVFKRFINIGIAVNTERGLVVPVIRDVNRLSIRIITEQLDELSKKARAGKLRPEEMQGGTFTISNLGGIGGTSFNPIVNAPEVAILGVSRAAEEVVPVNGEPKVRLILPLSLGYDHRVIDGAEGAEFLHQAVLALSDPFTVLTEV